ncbi:molybdate transport system ATP-binding protein [Loktanella fryxellensis]|uniref:Molybdate transport system ATP-binding protein n=1 Tax=Loktanella fryxellensis TaxID=245187 RepID=A0A1H8EP06_9RHOB|nr:molybdenum ABC transporter ATP-binding protein [Loktanella fryxellensis]SEN21120.1 molybdate transport system ATP-binding protein [Loktanella fryxellensis]
MLRVALTHRQGDFELDVSFDAAPGVTVLFGRSGSGKTTIVNAVAGLLRPDRGRITVGDTVLLDTDRGLRVPPHRRRLGYIFQDGRLFAHLTVRQNLIYGAWFAGLGRSPRALPHVLEMLGIGPLLARRPAGLSGGERQRVAIGRALLAQPRLILADEPLSALDDARKAEVLPYLERLRDEVQVPILYVSHAPAEVARIATTVVALEGGRVTGIGTAAQVLGDPDVAPLGIRSAGAVIAATLRRHHADGLSELDAGGIALFVPRIAMAPGTSVRLRIAAHDVILARDRPTGLSALNILPGTITAIRQGQGPGAMVRLSTPAGVVLARITARSAQALDLAPGTTAHAIIKSVAIAPDDVG